MDPCVSSDLFIILIPVSIVVIFLRRKISAMTPFFTNTYIGTILSYVLVVGFVVIVVISLLEIYC